MITRLAGAVREAEVLGKNAIQYSQAGDRYSVIVLFAIHPTTASVCQVQGLVQVDGSLACARVVAFVPIACSTIARFRVEEEYITASGIKKDLMALINHSGSCHYHKDSPVKLLAGSSTCMTPVQKAPELLKSTRGSDVLFKELLELRLRVVSSANGFGAPAFLARFDSPRMSFLIQHETQTLNPSNKASAYMPLCWVLALRACVLTVPSSLRSLLCLVIGMAKLPERGLCSPGCANTDKTKGSAAIRNAVRKRIAAERPVVPGIPMHNGAIILFSPGAKMRVQHGSRSSDEATSNDRVLL